MIGSIYLAKIYAPNLYGVYSVFLSIASILSVLSTFRLEYIIITEKADAKSTNLANTLIFIVAIATIAQLLVYHFTKTLFLNQKLYFSITILSIIAAFLSSNTRVIESISTRKSLFKIIANAKILTTSCTIIFQFILFYFLKESGLIYGYMASALATLIYFYVATRKKINTPNIDLVKATIKKHVNILRFGFPSGLLNTIALNVMPILMLSYFSSAIVGVYALSFKIVSIPLFIVSASVSQVYFQQASEYYNNEKSRLYDFTKKIAISNILIISIILLLINTIGIYLLTLFFDKDWENLRSIILFLSIYILGQSTYSPISSIGVITNKLHISLIFNISLLLINFIAIYIGNMYDNILLTVKFLSFIGGASYVILLIYFLSLLKTYKNEPKNFI